jgi:hypothetical protein
VNRFLYVTSLTHWRSEVVTDAEGAPLTLEWIRLSAPDGTGWDMPLVVIPEGFDRFDPSYRVLKNRAERLVGEAMKETTLVLWRTPQRYFVAMPDRSRIADLNEIWSAFEHPFLAPYGWKRCDERHPL